MRSALFNPLENIDVKEKTELVNFGKKMILKNVHIETKESHERYKVDFEEQSWSDFAFYKTEKVKKNAE